MREATGGLVFVYGGPPGVRGPFTFTGNQWRVSGAVTDEGSTGALFFAHAEGITIRDNAVVMPSERHMPFVELRSSSDVVAEDNDVYGAERLLLKDAESANVQVR